MTPELLEASRSSTPPHTDTYAVPGSAAPATLELDLFGFVALLLRNIRLIAGCSLLFFLVTLANMLHAKPRFSATAKMIVPQGNNAGKDLQQLTMSTLDLVGGGYELYADIIQSRTVQDRLIKDFDLKKVYGTTADETAEAILGSLTKVQTAPEGLISVTVQDTSPQRAADLANDYLHQLDILNGQLVLSSIGEQRVYLEREMVKEKNALEDAEVALKEVEESGSGVAPAALGAAGLSALESTRAELRAAQIHLASLLVSETDANPEVVRTRTEIAGLNGQLNTLQSGTVSTENGVPTRKVPEQELEYTRRQREVLFHETLFDLLAKQFEAAKQQESKTPSIVQVLDPAVATTHKAWPPRTYYCLLGAIAGFLFGIVLVALRGFVRSYVRNPRNEQKLHELKQIFRNPLGRSR